MINSLKYIHHWHKNSVWNVAKRDKEDSGGTFFEQPMAMDDNN